MKHCRLVALPLGLLAATAVGQQVQVEQLAPGRYELTLLAGAPMTEPAAQRFLRPRAGQLCNGIDPYFGAYRFESLVPLAGDDTAQDQKATFKFVQEISCGGAASSPTPDREMGVPRTDLVRPLEAFVKEISTRYLMARSQGNFAEAYAALSEYLRDMPLNDWSQRAKEFNDEAGELRSTTVWRVTVYENPPGAPQPGTYIAADFESTYDRIPLQCGYLVWLRLRGERFVITRQETGSIPPELFEPSRASELPRIKQEFGCAR
jgi:hypothetical protein